MLRFIILSCVLFLLSCSVEDFYQNALFPVRPENGYLRNNIFPNRLQNVANNVLYSMLDQRVNWNAQENKFKSLYPFFSVTLLGFNNLDEKNNFTWQERLMLSDALELVIFVINHPSFAKEMEYEEFFDNQKTSRISSSQVVEHIRKSKISVFFSKDSLYDGVLAQATLGGFAHNIWFRNDVNYQDYNLFFLTVILAHELTHNLGYTHDSYVPYGMQDVVVKVLYQVSLQETLQFKKNTPFYEQDFLTRVRTSKSNIKLQQKQMIVQDFYDDMLHNK